MLFSEIKKNQIKGWKKNKTTNQLITVIKGKVKFYLIDDRKKKNYKKTIYLMII